jgi:hypothetical protein
LYNVDRSRFYKNNLIARLEAIQQLLADRVFVEVALMALEQGALKQGALKFTDKLKYTKCLDLALAGMEATWTDKPRITLRTESKPKPKTPSPTLVAPSGPLEFQRQFLQKAVKVVAPIKDVGAPVSHGEFAHRIQWYIIAYYFRDAWTPAGLRYIHHAMGRQRFLQELETPLREDDALRSLWDYTLDVRLEEPKEVGDTRSVHLASPVRLTSKLLGYDYDSVEGKVVLGQLSEKYKIIARAVANKRRKRALEQKRREGKKLSKSELQELDADRGWVCRDAWLREKFRQLFE